MRRKLAAKRKKEMQGKSPDAVLILRMQSMTLMNKIKIFSIIFVLMFIPCNICISGSLITLSTGDKIPDFTVRTTEGKTLSIKKLKGKVVILVFWKKGTGYSQKSLLDLGKIHQEFKHKGLTVLAINSDKLSKKDIKGFKNKNNFDYLFAEDPELKVYGSFGTMVLPTTLIVDQEGKLVYYRSIYPRNYLQQVRGYVRFIIGEITRSQLDKALHPAKIVKKPDDIKKATRHLNLGRTLLSLNLKEKATQEFEKSIQTYPLIVEPHILLGRLYLEENLAGKAIFQIEQALKLDPDSKEAGLLKEAALDSFKEKHKGASKESPPFK